MAQLDLTALQLKEKGFYLRIHNSSVTYMLDTVNGYFYFNPLEEVYRWYHVTVIGGVRNHALLNIEAEIELNVVIKAFTLRA